MDYIYYTPRNEIVVGYTGLAVRPSVDKSYVVR